MEEVIALLFLLPIAAFHSWQYSIKKREPRDQELTKAAHGAAMVVLAIMYFVFSGGHYVPFPRPNETVLTLLGVTVVWGLFWLVTGASRSRGYRDSRIAMRAALKIGTGLAIYIFRMDIIFFLRPHLPQSTWNYAMWLGFAIMVWCIVTGAVKLGLVMRGPPTFDDEDVGDMPHGGSTFGRGIDE